MVLLIFLCVVRKAQGDPKTKLARVCVRDVHTVTERFCCCCCCCFNYDEEKMCTIIDDCLCLDEISLQTRFTLSHTENFVVQPIKIFEYDNANQKNLLMYAKFLHS